MNLLFLLPFVLIYEGALIATRCPVENAAAGWLRVLVAGLGQRGWLVVTAVIGSVYAYAIWRRGKEAPREKGLYAGMLLEGVFYGLVLGWVAQALASSMPMGKRVPLGQFGVLVGDVREVGLCVGAGVFEELVFRAGLLLGLYALARSALSADRLTSALVALLISSYVFSAYHHWGVFGEPYNGAVFAFRFHAGLVLGTLFLTRGLGIAALAHGVYDVMVTLG